MSGIVKRAPETRRGGGVCVCVAGGKERERRREEYGGVEAQSQKIALRAQWLVYLLGLILSHSPPLTLLSLPRFFSTSCSFSLCLCLATFAASHLLPLPLSLHHTVTSLYSLLLSQTLLHFLGGYLHCLSSLSLPPPLFFSSLCADLALASILVLSSGLEKCIMPPSLQASPSNLEQKANKKQNILSLLCIFGVIVAVKPHKGRFTQRTFNQFKHHKPALLIIVLRAINMSFKCLAQYNRSADTEWKPASTWPFLVWCSLKSKWVKPFLLNPYIIWPFLWLKSSHKNSAGGDGRRTVIDRQ